MFYKNYYRIKSSGDMDNDPFLEINGSPSLVFILEYSFKSRNCLNRFLLLKSSISCYILTIVIQYSLNNHVNFFLSTVIQKLIKISYKVV